MVISQHLAQYALRLPMVAAVGTYLWLHEIMPSGQVWASSPSEGEVDPGANHTAVPMYVTNGSSAPLAFPLPGASPASPRLNTPESDARPPALHLLANTMPRLDRVLVRSAWHARELGEQLALHGQPSSASARLIEPMPMAYDDDEWRQAKAAFAAENGAKVLRAPRLTSDPDPWQPPA